MKSTTIAGVLLMLAALAGVTGCSKEEPIGPAQKAGKAVDQAGEKVADGLRQGLAKADDAAQKLAQSAEKARDKVADAARDASKGLDEATGKVGEKVERAGEKLQEAAR